MLVFLTILESTSSYEAMLYVKKVVTDLKPEDSGGSERKKFYVEELTKVFQDGKLTVGLFLAGIFYHFLQRTAKENVLISKIGVSAEVGSSLDFLNVYYS